jgi:hypothetical protein
LKCAEVQRFRVRNDAVEIEDNGLQRAHV